MVVAQGTGSPDNRWSRSAGPACALSHLGCVGCGFAGLRDHHAAGIPRWAAVNQPYAARADVQAPSGELRLSAAASYRLESGVVDCLMRIDGGTYLLTTAEHSFVAVVREAVNGRLLQDTDCLQISDLLPELSLIHI